MNAETVISALAVVIAFVSAVISIRGANSTARLQHTLRQQEKKADREALAADLFHKYRDPLLHGAFDLASRIYNIVEKDFLKRYISYGSEAEQGYARSSTLFLFGQYLGWVELHRRGTQFLDIGGVEQERTLVQQLDRIADAMAKDGMKDRKFLIWRSDLRAIGECMLERSTDGADLQCIGYATFASRLADPSFSVWFDGLRKSVEATAADATVTYERLTLLQHQLMDLVEVLDDPPLRLPSTRRDRI